MSTSMSNNSAHLLLLLLFVSGVAVITPILATDHIVGANRGWNPGINYTLWANNHTFYVGDFISFRYQKNQYNVFMVNQSGYDNCTLDSAVGNWSSGKDFILFNKSERYYFICGNGQCFNGMKVTVLVHPLLTPTASPSPKNSTSDSAGPVAPRLGFRVLVTSLAVMWFGGAGLSSRRVSAMAPLKEGVCYGSSHELAASMPSGLLKSNVDAPFLQPSLSNWCFS